MKRKERERITKRNKAIISILAVFLMISSIGGFVVLNSPSQSNTLTRTYDGVRYTFSVIQDSTGNLFYEVKYDDRTFNAFYLPDELFLEEKISNYLNNVNFFYLTFSPNISDLSYVDYIRYDLQQNIPNNIFYQSGIIEENPEYNLPIISCENATIIEPVIFLEEGNETTIILSDNCITIKNTLQDVLRVRDILVYTLNGVNLQGG